MQPTLSTATPSASHARVRFALTLAGIVIAILCLLALGQDLRSADRVDSRAPRIFAFSKVVATNLVSEVKARL
jgi:hypothetical protein